MRAEIARAGMSQRQFAARLGWEPSLLAKRLRPQGGIPFRADELSRIADELNIPIERLYAAGADPTVPAQPDVTAS